MPPADPRHQRLKSHCYFLTLRQNPQVGKSVGSRLSDRRPLDPPPIVRLQIKDDSDPPQNYLQSPYYFCVCTLYDPVEDVPASYSGHLPPLAGSLVSSLHKLKDISNEDGGFFVFGDLCVRPEGEFRLRFALYEMLDGEVAFHNSCLSDPFRVHTTKTFPGLPESTYVSRAFSDQGVRLRIRKEGRISTKRFARTQNITEDDGYDAKQAQNPSPVLQQQPSYNDATFPQVRADLDHRQTKRMRLGPEIAPLRDSWTYTTGAHTGGIYTAQYDQNYAQNIPQTFSQTSPPYGTSNVSPYQNMLQQYSRPAQAQYMQAPYQTDTMRLNFRFPLDDSVRHI